MKVIGMLVLILGSFNASAAIVGVNPDYFKFTGDSYIDLPLSPETRVIGYIWSSDNTGAYLTFLASSTTTVMPLAPISFNDVDANDVIDPLFNSPDLLNFSLVNSNYTYITRTDIQMSTTPRSMFILIMGLGLVTLSYNKYA